MTTSRSQTGGIELKMRKAKGRAGFERSPTTSDNADVEPKLDLRRHFLTKYLPTGRKAVVLDCCQAGGLLWRTLRTEYAVTYWGVDRVPRKGRLAIDSARLLLAPSLAYDVVDVDTYGSPWQHWSNLLPNVARPMIVFLTLGRAGGIKSVDSAVLRAVGLHRMSRMPPQALRWKLDHIAVESCLALCYRYGVRIVETMEVDPPSPNARYFGLYIEPTKAAPPAKRT